MFLNLENKVILITGSSKGLGFGIAEKLNDFGSRVILNARCQNNLQIAVNKLPGSTGIAADVSDPIEAARLVQKVLEKTGHLDGLVCNVGSGRSVAPGAENYNEWQRVFSQNLWSATNMVECAADALAKRSGSIVCISSICGQEVVFGAPVTYSAAKAALNSYVQGISRPLGARGVRINAVAPGNLIFDGSVWEKKVSEDANRVDKMLNENVALKKLGKPTDVSNLVAYLLSPVANFATGAIFTIDGGQKRG